MKKVSIEASNRFCPQTLFLYGTYKEDGSPNFGLFCWFSYYWDKELGVMTCIGGEKLTKDRIKAGNAFSANLVTEALLPLADYLGNNDGYDPQKMNIPIEVEKGAVLPVPILKDSPWIFELSVKQSIPTDDGEVFLCQVKNTLVAAELEDKSLSIKEQMKTAAPVITMGEMRYFSINPTPIAEWGKWKEFK